MDDKSWDVFIKRVLVDNRISGIMCENPGGSHGFLLPPSDDAHAYLKAKHRINHGRA